MHIAVVCIEAENTAVVKTEAENIAVEDFVAHQACFRRCCKK